MEKHMSDCAKRSCWFFQGFFFPTLCRVVFLTNLKGSSFCSPLIFYMYILSTAVFSEWGLCFQSVMLHNLCVVSMWFIRRPTCSFKKIDQKNDKLIMFSICCATHECDSTETNLQPSSCSVKSAAAVIAQLFEEMFSPTLDISWARQIFVSFLKWQIQLHLKQWADVLNYRPGQSRTRWKYMLKKFAACLSTLFVFCRNNLHLFLFFFFQFQHLPSATFPPKTFLRQLSLCPHHPISWNVKKLCRQNVSSWGLSVCDESGLFCWSGWRRELWAFGRQLLRPWDVLRKIVGRETRKRAFISLPILPFCGRVGDPMPG